MKLIDYYVWMKLLGYELLNVSWKKVMKKIDIEQHKKKLQDFIRDHLDKKMLADYFMLGVKAGVFRDIQTGKILTDDDQLMFGYLDNKFQYTVRRQSIARQREAKGARAMAKILQSQAYLQQQRQARTTNLKKDDMKGVRLD